MSWRTLGHIPPLHGGTSGKTWSGDLPELTVSPAPNCTRAQHSTTFRGRKAGLTYPLSVAHPAPCFRSPVFLQDSDYGLLDEFIIE